MTKGFSGEALVNKQVWVIKSHYPERVSTTKYYSERAILLVRNPIDAIVSYFNMMATGSHNHSIDIGDYKTLEAKWIQF